MMASDKIKALTEQLNNIAREIQSDTTLGLESDVEQRAKLIEATKSILNSVKQPTDAFVDQSASICELAASRLFIKWKAFEQIPLDRPITFQELASKLDADVSLIARFASVLASTGLLQQVGTDQIAHTQRSKPYATVEAARAMTQLLFDDHLPTLLAMPAYFDEHGLAEPTGRHGTIFAFAAGSPDSTVWEVMNREPARMRAFMLGMGALTEEYPIVGSYDFAWAAAANGDDRAVLVDVGGGKGHAIKAIRAQTPGLEVGRCVLEDLPAVIEGARGMDDPELRGVRMVGMDFHAEQPVKGALIYYIRRCLHDYGDEECVAILKRLSDAMASDSRLLIVEQVLASPPSPFAAVADFFMATIGGKERSLAAFQAIVSKAQLKIREVYRNPGTDVATIECVRE